MPLDAASLVMHRAFLVLGTYSEIGPVQRDLLKVSFSPDSGHVADIPAGPSSATSRHPHVLNGIGYLAGIALATARAQSMKTCATGLNVRFFSLMMATGLG
jgi:hypothetical protein